MSVSGDDDLALAARMRALSAFAPAYLHDLKGPLNTIVLRVALLRGTGGDDSTDRTVVDSLDVIDAQVQRLARLLDDWVAATVLAPAAETDLTALLQRCIAIVAPTGRKRQCELRLDSPAAALVIGADPMILGGILLELLHEALARADARSTIVLRVEQQATHALLAIADARLDSAALCAATACVSALGGTCRLTPGGGVEMQLPL